MELKVTECYCIKLIEMGVFMVGVGRAVTRRYQQQPMCHSQYCRYLDTQIRLINLLSYATYLCKLCLASSFLITGPAVETEIKTVGFYIIFCITYIT